MFISILILFVSVTPSLFSQEIIFPGLRGDSLITELKKYYTPKKVLSYDDARTKLYSEIFLKYDSIECYYSCYKIPIPENINVLSWTAKYGIQTEHLFPRSLGSAAMPALADLHHLVPSKSTINTIRRNAPFKDIDDTKTKYWLYNDKVLTKPIPKIIDLFSESSPSSFEPRETMKGDIARSIFYFYTFYRTAANKKSKTFFSSMLPDLCRWHRSDKVDSTEYLKTMAIARVQGNINPFIIDPTLPERCYCKPPSPYKIYVVNIYPNPSKGLFYIDIPGYKGPIVMTISTQPGKLLESDHLMYSGLMSWRVGKGIHKITFTLDSSQQMETIVLIQ